MGSFAWQLRMTGKGVILRQRDPSWPAFGTPLRMTGGGVILSTDMPQCGAPGRWTNRHSGRVSTLRVISTLRAFPPDDAIAVS